MPSIISHPAVPLALGLGLGSATIPRRLLVLGILGSIVPDVDVYLQQITSSIGHRGITHTVVFSVMAGLFAAAISQRLEARAWTAFWFVGLATVSHGVLDAFTNGGAGIPILWPVTDERFFAPWRVIEVSPLGITSFFSARGLSVIWSELRWIWLPTAVFVAILWTARRTAAPARQP